MVFFKRYTYKSILLVSIPIDVSFLWYPPRNRRHSKEMTKAQHNKAIQILEVLGLDYVELVPSGLPNKYRYRAWSLPKAAQNGERRRERKGKVRIPAKA